MTLAARGERCRHLVLIEVRLDELVDVAIGTGVDACRQIADTEGIDAETEASLGLDLVALGDGDLAHVVPEPSDPAGRPVTSGARGPRPHADPLLDGAVRPMADHDGPFEPQPGSDVSEFAIAVRGLVEVHEIHVDRRPRDLLVELRVQ